MPNEEFEKKVDFIVEQQGQFTAQIGQIEEVIARLAKATHGRFEATDKRVDKMDEKMSALVNAQMLTEQSVKQTTESLRNLIAVVDRYFSEKRNGQSEK